MSTYNLPKLFNPESVAVIGASERKGGIGESIMRNLISGTFNGDIYPVNPNYTNIMGIPAVSDIKDITATVDMAVIATPIKQVSRIIEICGEKDIKGAVVISAGGKEAGKEGEKIEAEIKIAAQRSGIRIIGPNCLGIVNTEKGLNASFMHQFPLAGKTAFLSQSGAVCTSVLDLSMRENVGFSHFVSLGSMLDVDFADMIDYLGSLRQVESIVMYIENITNIRNFMSAARAVSRVKPIIALKSGRSAAGARAAASHTGALAGSDSVYDAAFKRAGILRVSEFEELFDCTEFLSKQKQPKGGRLAIITNAGGPGVMAADALAAHGLEPAELSIETIRKLDQSLKKEWSRANPVDILGDATPEQYIQAAEICSQAPETDGLLLISAPVGTFDSTVLAEPLSGFLKTVDCPVFTAWIGGDNIDKSRAIFNREGIVTYDTAEKAVRAFANLYQYGRNIEMLHEIPVRKDKNIKIDKQEAFALIESTLTSGRTVLTEIQAKKLLMSYGIPVNRTEIAQTAREAIHLAEEIGFPVVLKICSKDILHKSDSGGVALNLLTREQVENAFAGIMKTVNEKFPGADIDGVSVQAMSLLPDYELILGAKTDRDFGPVLLFGMGGVMTEIYRDTALALPPLNHGLAGKTIENTKISKAMKGFRNFKAVDATRVEEIMIRLDRLVTDFPEIEELDINPLIVRNGTVMGVDARVIVRRTDVLSPAHLVISPYPSWQEALCRTIDDEPFLVRPIRPEDAGRMIDLFAQLSPQTIYLRFFSPIKQLSKQMLIKFTQIDYDREVALVAMMDATPGDQKMVGVARIIFMPDGKTGEFAIVLADHWQGKGIGAALLKRCLLASKKLGLKKVCGLVLSENTQMLKLGKKLGFVLKRSSDSYDMDLEINLENMDLPDEFFES